MMNTTSTAKTADKKSMYKLLNKQLKEVIGKVPYRIANLANASALLNQTLTDINWVGFYFMEDGNLVLGPFQGKLACTVIKVGCGVCGTTVEQDEIMLVDNVHEFPGHIACDCASNSEIVIPIHKDREIIGVLDIDSPSFARFDQDDKDGLAEFVKVLENYI